MKLGHTHQLLAWWAGLDESSGTAGPSWVGDAGRGSVGVRQQLLCCVGGSQSMTSGEEWICEDMSIY